MIGPSPPSAYAVVRGANYEGDPTETGFAKGFLGSCERHEVLRCNAEYGLTVSMNLISPCAMLIWKVVTHKCTRPNVDLRGVNTDRSLVVKVQSKGHMRYWPLARHQICPLLETERVRLSEQRQVVLRYCQRGERKTRDFGGDPVVIHPYNLVESSPASPWTINSGDVLRSKPLTSQKAGIESGWSELGGLVTSSRGFTRMNMRRQQDHCTIYRSEVKRSEFQASPNTRSRYSVPALWSSAATAASTALRIFSCADFAFDEV